MVRTSSSVAPSQMTRLNDKQNCLLQSAQVRFCVSSDRMDDEVEDPGPSRAIILLLVKHEHLQNDVGAGVQG